MKNNLLKTDNKRGKYGVSRRKTAHTLIMIMILAAALLLTMPLICAPAFAGDIFSDIAGHWGRANIIRAAELGYVQGFPDGTFAPERPISRGEFIALFARSQKLPTVDTSGHWATKYVHACQAAGILPYEYSTAHVYLDEKIQRIEAVRLLAILADSISLPQNVEPPAFNDTTDLSTADLTALEAVLRTGIMRGGSGGAFMPHKTTTRAEIATIFVNIASKIPELAVSDYASTGYGIGETFSDTAAAAETFNINGDIVWKVLKPAAKGGECFVILDKNGRVIAATVPSLPENAGSPIDTGERLEYNAGGKTYWVYKSNDPADRGLVLLTLEIDPTKKRILSDQLPSNIKDFERAADYITNIYRYKSGSPLLSYLASANKAGRLHSENMIKYDFFDHTGPSGKTFSARLSEAGINWANAGENIAAGYNEPISLICAWINSPGHRVNLLGDFEFASCAVAVDSKHSGSPRIVAVQLFITLMK